MKRQHNTISSKILRAVFETTSLKDCFKSKSLDRICELGEEKLKKLLIDRTSYAEYDLVDHINMYCASLSKVNTPDFFDIVIDFSSNMICRTDNHFCFNYEFTDIWISTIRKTGEELFVTAGVVLDDLKCGLDKERREMNWQYCIEHNNHELKQMLNRSNGVSENHFHLRSSSPYFDISWIYLMNDVESGKYQNAIEKIQSNRLNESSYHTCDFPLTVIWRKAAFLRCILFNLIQLKEENEEYFKNNEKRLKEIESELNEADEIICKSDDKCDFSDIRCIQNIIDKYPKIRIDYAGRDIVYTDRQCDFISGERFILYNCLRKIILKETGHKTIRSYLFLYLLMKNRFYSEMIQTNTRNGFFNFNTYQARKDMFIPWENEINVATETIYYVLNESRINSFEMRIYPNEKSNGIISDIKRYDQAIENARQRMIKRRGNCPYKGIDFCFYTMYFIKDTDQCCKNCNFERCRNNRGCRHSQLRKRVERQTYAIMSLDREMFKRIRGIDAAGEEIKCRPENFAAQFRRLLYYFKPYPKSYENIQLKATYHVGEDNHDLLDGLRAIYEAIMFLDLRSGCRLGHATLLGNFPADYYNSERNPVAMPCQVFLDNLVWMYYFFNEHGIKFDRSELLYDFINKNIRIYFDKIFGSELNINKITAIIYSDMDLSDEQRYNILEKYKNLDYNINDYYHSYLLRGDDPSLYYRFYSTQALTLNYPQQYKICNTHEYMQSARESERARYLYFLYHYSCKVKKTGEELVHVKLPDYFIDGIELIQEELRRIISFRGIAVETNPSSNLLISNFHSYDEHPISVFYDHVLLKDSTKVQMNVSVNTDDKSIFSTSLSNEYAYLMYYLENKKDKNGNYMYTRFNILQWLDEIRRMGNEQSFKF